VQAGWPSHRGLRRRHGAEHATHREPCPPDRHQTSPYYAKALYGG